MRDKQDSQDSQARADGVTIRALEPGDGTDALFDLRCRAFGPFPGGDRALWQQEQEPVIREQRYLGAFDGARLVAAARFHDMTQWWYGRAVPMAGVASVAVGPQERGRGVGRSLMTALLEVIASRGYPVSVLYPSTMPIYRALGWEIAGTSYEAVFAAHALRSLATSAAPPGRAAGLRRAGPGDAAQAREVLGRVHAAARDCGPSVRDEATIRLALGDENEYVYLADDGMLACTWRDGGDQLFVHTAVAASEQTTRALWAIVASHCWIADTVRARVAPADPVWWLSRDPIADIVDHDDWMLRVVDPVAAIAARGFPPAADLAIFLQITDAARAGNCGLWRLAVSGGSGSLSRVRPADGEAISITLSERGLAALYAGAPVATLRRSGLVAGGDAQADALLDGAFAAAPFMLDRF
jgi:predicted acetyltransferase